jgi:hypothetical protein
MRSSTLPVGTDRSVQCPIRGEINVSTCAECPLLIKLANRRGRVTVLCCLPREKRSADLNPSDRWLAYRASPGSR